MSEKVESDLTLRHDNKITQPHIKPVDKQLVLANLGDWATLPGDIKRGMILVL